MAANKCFSSSGRETARPHWRATVAYWAATGEEGLKRVPKASKQRRRLGLGSRGIVLMGWRWCWWWVGLELELGKCGEASFEMFWERLNTTLLENKLIN